MLITRPNHDVTTNYLYYWSKKIIAQAYKGKEKVVDLIGKRANKKEFICILRKINPSFVVMNGHGDEKTISGYDNEILIELNNNESILSGKIVFARSCRAAARLGRLCINKGTKTFIGYTDDFIFFINEAQTSHPLEDETAKLFLEPSNYVAIVLLKGHKTAVANERSKDLYRQNVQKLMTSETPKENKELIPFLRWNMINQVCLGDKNARI